MNKLAHYPPILVVYFNRPEVLYKNLIALSEFKPTQLYFACDGPRINNESDIELINKCKEIATSMITWECKVYTMFSNINYGCDTWVPKAITWFFSKVDAGIILEDDCVIDKNFAFFAKELLEKYENDTNVMNISAASFQNKHWGTGDYFFSKYPANWGWATWARSWKHYDPCFYNKENISEVISELLLMNMTKVERKYWHKYFIKLKSGNYSFWDAKWVFSIWINNGISITPNNNMVVNIGFGRDATHTKHRWDDQQMNIKPLNYLINHPVNDFQVCHEADLYHFNVRYKPKLIARLWSLLNKIYKLLNFVKH